MNSEKCVLHDLLRIAFVADKAQGELQNSTVIAFDKLSKRFSITCPSSVDQCVVGFRTLARLSRSATAARSIDTVGGHPRLVGIRHWTGLRANWFEGIGGCAFASFGY